MKKAVLWVWIFLGVLIGIFLSEGVSASHNCNIADPTDTSQVILRLSGTDNAHGELFDQTNYVATGEEVCFNEIFPGRTGSGSRVCEPNDKHLILRLSDVTNAHAEEPITDISGQPFNYDIKVCYEDLKFCELNTTIEGCSSGKQQIVKLSDSTNAHLELRSQNNYDQVVCCELSDPGIIDIRWENMLGEIIDGGNVYIGNTVKLVARRVVPIPHIVDFNISEYDLIDDDDIRVGEFSATSITVDPWSAEVIWTITEEDYNRGWQNFGDDDNEGDILQLYFVANGRHVDTNVNNEISAQIFLQPETQNDPPTAIITGQLEHRGIYFVGTEIEFNHTSFDIDGIIESVRWTIDEEGFTSSENSFVQTFATAGMKTITLRVTDNQGASDEKQIAILVLASPGMLAFINKPEHQEIVRADNLLVDYLGNDSYVVNYIDCANLNCLAGNCPAYTENVPSTCTTEDDTDLDGNLDIAVGGTPQPFSSLNFNWTFSSQGQPFSFNTGGFNVFGGQHRYGLPSSAPNDKSILLNLSYLNEVDMISLNQSVRRVFTLLEGSSSNGGCFGNELWLFEGNSIRRRSLFDEETPPACFGPDGVFGGVDCTCPGPFHCDPNGGGCITQSGEEEPIDECGDYRSENACNNDVFRAARIDPLWDFNNCDEVETQEGIKNCKCGWRPVGSPSPPGACLFIVNVTPWEPPSGGGAVCSYECNYLSTESATGCSEGYIDLGVQADFINHETDPSCNSVYYSPGGAEEVCLADSGQYTLPCGRPEIKLPLFGAMQFAISVLAVFVIYFILLRGKLMRKEKLMEKNRRKVFKV